MLRRILMLVALVCLTPMTAQANTPKDGLPVGTVLPQEIQACLPIGSMNALNAYVFSTRQEIEAQSYDGKLNTWTDCNPDAVDALLTDHLIVGTMVAGTCNVDANIELVERSGKLVLTGTWEEDGTCERLAMKGVFFSVPKSMYSGGNVEMDVWYKHNQTHQSMWQRVFN